MAKKGKRPIQQLHQLPLLGASADEEKSFAAAVHAAVLDELRLLAGMRPAPSSRPEPAPALDYREFDA